MSRDWKNNENEKSKSRPSIAGQVSRLHDYIDELSGKLGNLQADSAAPAEQVESLQAILEELQTAEEAMLEQLLKIEHAQYQLATERSRYLELFESAPDGYLVTDRHGIILQANQTASRILNVPLGYLDGKPVAIFIPREERSEFRRRLNRLASLAKTSQASLDDWELHFIPRSLETHTFSISVTTVRNPRLDKDFPFTLRWLLRDVSRRKQIEDDLEEIQDKLIESRERERQRIARQLHDGPIQDLYGVSFRLSSITEDSNWRESFKSLKQAQADLETVIIRLRDICSELRPPSLIPFGLKQAILSHAEQFEQKNPGLQVTVNAQLDQERLPETERLAIFRIYQHLMANVARHAQASQVYIHIDADESEFMMVIEDNGVGFEPPNHLIEMVRTGHFGLADADDRAKHIGARLEITSKPGSGAHIRLTKKLTPE